MVLRVVQRTLGIDVEGRRSARPKLLEHDVEITHEHSISIEGKQWSIVIRQDEPTNIPEVCITTCKVGWMGDSLMNSPEVRIFRSSTDNRSFSSIEKKIVHNPTADMEAMKYYPPAKRTVQFSENVESETFSSMVETLEKDALMADDETSSAPTIEVKNTHDRQSDMNVNRIVRIEESQFLQRMLSINKDMKIEVKYVKHRKSDGYKIKLNSYNMSLLKDTNDDVLRLCLAKRPKLGINPDEVRTKYKNMLITLDFNSGDGEKEVLLTASEYATIERMIEAMSSE
jgi:hypothetical protein